jgi:hypothetical protein
LWDAAAASLLEELLNKGYIFWFRACTVVNAQDTSQHQALIAPIFFTY